MSLKDAKIWGGVGAILCLIGLGIVGFILKLIGVKKISDATGNYEIFQKYLYAAVLAVIASVMAVVAYYPLMMRGKFFINVLALGATLTTFVVAIILLIIAVIFMKKSYDLIAVETGVGWFKTVATLYIIGAVLLFVGIGAIVLLIAAILEIVAFFSLPDTVPKSQM